MRVPKLETLKYQLHVLTRSHPTIKYGEASLCADKCRRTGKALIKSGFATKIIVGDVGNRNTIVQTGTYIGLAGALTGSRCCNAVWHNLRIVFRRMD